MTKNHNVRPYKRHQHGVALLIVMLIMALMTGLAATMASRMFVNFNRVESQLNYQQAYWFALSIEELAKFGIQDSFSNDDPVTLSQPWAVRDEIYPLDQGEAIGSVYDQQACFNLNAFYKSEASSNSNENPILVTILQRLMESQGVESTEAEIAATSTWEFIDKNNNVQSTAGVEDSEYESRMPPYVTANGYLSDVSEWRSIYGVSQQTYQKVAPFLCALPTNDLKVNINTVEGKDAPLLAAILHPYLTEEKAFEIISNREPVNGYRDVNSFFAEPGFVELSQQNRELLQSFFDIKSRYFEVDATITLDESSLRIRSLLHRDDKGKVSIVRRRFGGTSERNISNTTEQ